MFTLAQAQPEDALSHFAKKTYRDTFAKNNTAENMELYVAWQYHIHTEKVA